MIAHSIQVAIGCDLFEHVVVSTDDQEIADVALQYGALVPFKRPDHLADDYATTLNVMAHAVRACESKGWVARCYCCLYATAPFVTETDIRRGFEALLKPGVSHVFSATRFEFLIQRTIKISDSGAIIPAWPEFIAARSQDLEPMFHDVGQFYWGQVKAFASKAAFFAAHSRAVILPDYRVQEIDDEKDWHRAELMHAVWQAEI